jgi:hypothetical protein
MRFLSLLSFLLVLKCGSGPTSDVDVTANDVVAEQEESVATTPAESEAEVAAASADVEEAEEVLRIWDRAWPETADRRDSTVPTKTEGGIVLNRTFVTDTVNLTPDWDEDSRVDAIFVSLIDFAAGKNLKVNDAINTELMSRIVERPTRTGAPRARLRDAARRATRDFQREQQKELEDEQPGSFRHAVTTTVWQNDDAFLVMTLEAYEYRGGAHGGFFRDDLSFSTKTGQLIRFKDVILRDERTAFLATLHAAALAAGHDNISDAKDFPLPDNFLFTAEGISFHYPEYSKVLSNRWTVELVVPFSQLSNKLTETGIEMMNTQRLNGDADAQVRSLEPK